MKNKISAKIAIALLIIIGMMPLNMENLYAYTENNGGPIIGYVFSFERLPGSNNIKMMCDFYFYSDILVNTYLVCDINKNFTMPGTQYSNALLESDGTATKLQEYQLSGSNITYSYLFKLENCSYFHFRITHSSDSYWTDNNMALVAQRAGAGMHYGTNAAPSNGHYRDYYNNNSYSSSGVSANSPFYLKQILEQLKTMSGETSITIDLSSVTDFLDEMLEVMDIQLAQEYEINTKMNIIINLLEAQQGSDTETSIDNNTNTNEALQNEVDDYNDIETDLTTDFNTNLEDINVSDWKLRLQGWGDGILWLKTQMNNMYTSLGDFKYLAEIGMLLAIALIFIGR